MDQRPNVIGAVTRGGRAVEGARVLLRPPGDGPALETVTDASGEFSFAAPPGAWRLEVIDGDKHLSRPVGVDGVFAYAEFDLDRETTLRIV